MCDWECTGAHPHAHTHAPHSTPLITPHPFNPPPSLPSQASIAASHSHPNTHASHSGHSTHPSPAIAGIARCQPPPPSSPPPRLPLRPLRDQGQPPRPPPLSTAGAGGEGEVRRVHRVRLRGWDESYSVSILSLLMGKVTLIRLRLLDPSLIPQPPSLTPLSTAPPSPPSPPAPPAAPAPHASARDPPTPTPSTITQHTGTIPQRTGQTPRAGCIVLWAVGCSRQITSRWRGVVCGCRGAVGVRRIAGGARRGG